MMHSSHWRRVTIGQLTTKVGSGATPKGGRGSYNSSGIPLIRSMNVHFGGFKYDNLAFIDDAQAKALDNVVVQERDVLLNITGASIGRVTQAPRQLEGARVNQHVCIIRPVSDALSPEYLRHFLSSPHQQQLMLAQETGGTRQALTKAKILRFDVPLPPLPEQRRIAAILDKADEIRRKRQEAIRLTEELLRSAFLEMFGDPVTNPKGWKSTTVGKLCDKYNGRIQTGPFGSQLHASDYSAEGTPVVMPQDLVGGGISIRRIARVGGEHVSRLERHQIEFGDVLFSRRGDVARFAVVKEAEAGWLCGTGCLRVRFGQAPVTGHYLQSALSHPAKRVWLEQEAKGTTMLNLNTSILAGLPLRIPPMSHQQRFAAIVGRVQNTQQLRQAVVHSSDNLFNSLVQRAFRGEL